MVGWSCIEAEEARGVTRRLDKLLINDLLIRVCALPVTYLVISY